MSLELLYSGLKFGFLLKSFGFYFLPASSFYCSSLHNAYPLSTVNWEHLFFLSKILFFFGGQYVVKNVFKKNKYKEKELILFVKPFIFRHSVGHYFHHSILEGRSTSLWFWHPMVWVVMLTALMIINHSISSQTRGFNKAGVVGIDGVMVLNQ